jgi:adenylate cyclase
MAIIEQCRAAADHFNLNGLLELYCERVREFRENPPPSDWNGVYALQTK